MYARARLARRSSATWSPRRSCTAPSEVEKPALPRLPERAGHAPGQGDARPVIGGRASEDIRRRPRSTRWSDVRKPATRSRGRRSSSARVDHLRDPARTAAPGSTSTSIFHLEARGGLEPWPRSTRHASSSPKARRRSAGTGRRWTRCSPSPSACSRRPATTTACSELEMKDSDPLRFEKLFSRVRGGHGLRARDGAQHLRLADRARAGRDLLRPLHARGGQRRALDRDHRPRPHDVRGDQVHGPQRLGGQPGDPAGRHLRQQRPDDRRRPQRRRADLRPDLRPGRRRADRVGRRRHARAGHRRDARRAASPSGPTIRFDDGIDLPA